MSERKTIAITSSDDLAALYGTYNELVAGGRELTLELEVAPGEYGVASIGPIQLDLGGNPPPNDPQIDVVIRGAPGVVFRDLGIQVRARSLRLEQLVLTGRRQGLLDARVAHSFAMHGCVVAANSWDPSWPGALLRVGGLVDQPAFTVELDDCWFAGNSEQAEAALLEVTPATGSFVERVGLRGVRFVGNATRSDLVVHETRELRARDLFVVKDARNTTFLRYDRCETVAIDHSTFVLGQTGALLAEDTRTWFSGLELSDSTVHAGGVVRKLPTSVRGNSQVRDGVDLAARAGQLRDLIDAVTRGARPDVAALRDALAL
ncbi:MAG TPA: hypothetical protein VGC42_29990 [Kofleriaceae bacterium]